jgi:hypothetical protein
MNQDKYIGHTSQLYGVEEHRLVGGKGDGMRLLQVKNGKGLEFTVSADRCADISRLSFKGDNFGYFSPCGYVSPQYYDDQGIGFLKSFTAGFLTTCGLTAVGSPCIDNEENLPLHGTIANTPAENIFSIVNEKEINIQAVINQVGIFADKLQLTRSICSPLDNNVIKITDTVRNNGCQTVPIMLLYHLNMGYPLLDENTELWIPSKQIIPRNDHAKDGLADWNKIISPQAGFEEQCFYHVFDNQGLAMIFNSVINKGLAIRFDTQELDCFVEWKMMGEKDYVLGLEPGNCLPDGRDVMRKTGKLKFIEPNETKTYHVTIEIIMNEEQWKKEAGFKV